MDILGIGPMELLLILIVALMVFGPDRLPTIGSKLGRAMRDMRRATRAISDEISATREAIEAPAKELTEPFEEIADAAKSMSSVAAAARNPGEAIRQSVLKELNAPASPVQAPTPPIDPDNTIAPPELIQATIPEALPADETPESSTAAADAAPDAIESGETPEAGPQETLEPGGQETPPQSTDDSLPVMEP